MNEIESQNLVKVLEGRMKEYVADCHRFNRNGHSESATERRHSAYEVCRIIRLFDSEKAEELTEYLREEGL